ncbi:MAG: HAD family hydrolase [Sulfolobales archaeon]
MSLKLIVFDLDGTLIDSVDAHAEGWSFAITHLGLAHVGREELVDLIGLPGSEIVKEVLGEAGLRQYPSIRWLKDRHFLNQVAVGRVRLFPDVMPCLNYLRERGYALGLATSTPNYILVPLLERLELLDYFDYTVGGDEVRRGKPNPDIFIRVVEKAGVRPSDTAVVGDTVYDTVPARSAGMFSILVARKREVRARNFDADVVIKNLLDLRLLL